MGQLFQTVKTKNQHYHIAYVDDQGNGMTSVNSGHSHGIVFRNPQQEIIDQDMLSPSYGQVVQEASDGGLTVLPGEKDGHTHTLTDYVPSQKEDNETDRKIVDDVISLYKEAKQREENSISRGNSANDFYANKQWGKNDEDKPVSRERAALTINLAESKMDTLSGYQRQNRTDFRFFPTEEGDQRVADILNVIIKNVTDQCNYSREETKVFDDAGICGRGIFNIYDDYETDIRGKIVIEKFKWDEVFFGPHEKEDLSDCDYLIKTKWFPLSKLKEMYPEKWDRFGVETQESDVGNTAQAEDWDTRRGEITVAGTDTDIVNLAKKQYRMLEAWRKKYKKIKILVNDDGFVFSADGWTAQDINSVKTIPGFRVIPRVAFDMRVTKVISGVMLEDEFPDLAVNDFHVVPVYCKYRDGEFWGKIETIKDLQRLVNKAFSLFSDIHNKMVAYGWFYDDTTFATPNEERKFKESSSSPGFTVKLSDATRPPTKVEGTKFPTELINGITVFNQYIKEIMNVNMELMGNSPGNESGVAIRQKIVQQLLGNDFLFDNLSFAKKKIGKIIVGMIQKLWNPERILRIIGNQDQREQEGVQIAGQPFSSYNANELASLLQNADLTNYDVLISESPSSPSSMLSNFMLLIEMAGKGVPIPPTAFFKFAPIPGKEKILAEIQAAQQEQQAQENQKYETEIKKSLIAQEGKNNARQAAAPSRQVIGPQMPIVPQGGGL